MSYGSLIAELALTGSRKSDGTANASGRVWFFQVGTTTTATAYADATATTQLTQPVTLDAAGKVPSTTGGPYITAAVRVVVEYLVGGSTYATLSDYAYLPADAGAVGVRNSGFTGTNASGTLTAGGDTTLNAVLTSLAASVGGTDGQYLESSGATARTIKSKFAELSISVKDFGAKGDGIAIDTTAIQAAVNRAVALGGGEVYFPGGNYKLDGAISVGNKVSLRGASRTATTITCTSSTANAFSFASAGGFTVSSMYITNTGTSTGAGISLSGCNSYTIRDVSIDSFKYGIDVTGATSYAGVIFGCLLDGQFNDNTFRGIHYNTTGGTNGPHAVIGCDLSANLGAAIEFTGATSSVKCLGNHILAGSATGVLFNASLTGTQFSFTGNSFAGATAAFSFAGATMPGGFSQHGNGVDGYKGGLLTGATFTPDLSKGWNVTVDATTTGSAYTIAVPTPPPAATDYGVFMKLTLYCHAAGAITGWGMAAGYHTSSDPSTTDTHRTTYLFNWDPDGSVWREVSRSDTT